MVLDKPSPDVLYGVWTMNIRHVDLRMSINQLRLSERQNTIIESILKQL